MLQTLDVIDPDDCCTRALQKALLSGDLEGKAEWTHAKCGCDWKCSEAVGVRHWTPVVMIWRI